jgi:hypothetical protein
VAGKAALQFCLEADIRAYTGTENPRVGAERGPVDSAPGHHSTPCALARMIKHAYWDRTMLLEFVLPKTVSIKPDAAVSGQCLQ